MRRLSVAIAILAAPLLAAGPETSKCGAGAAGTPAILTRVSSASANIVLSSGKGETTEFFVAGRSAGRPEIVVTDAQGTSNKIPLTDIHVEGIPPSLNPNQLVAVRLLVDTKTQPEPDMAYKALVMFCWADGRVSLEITLTEKSKLDFQILRDKIQVNTGFLQPVSTLIRIKNAGNVPLASLSASSFSLEDNVGGHRVNLPEQDLLKGKGPVAPRSERLVSLDLPQPQLAGTYSGSLDIVANGQQRQSVSFALQTRGPDAKHGIPIILFFAVLGAGYLISLLLDRWFRTGGGLQRAQAIVSLRRSADIFGEIQKFIQELAGKGLDAAHTKLRLAIDVGDVQRALAGSSDMDLAALLPESQRLATHAAEREFLRQAVNVALQQWPNDPNRLKLVVAKLDEQMPGSDALAYRDALNKILENGILPEDEIAFFRASSAAADLPGKIRRMALLYAVLLFVVIAITAWQTFYAKPAFGAALDYCALFLWALGLTQTGKELIARAHSS